MLRNHIKIAIRSLLKHRFYTFINILGLSVGIACCLLIVLFVKDELSFDRHHQKFDRIYRITTDHRFNGRDFVAATTPAPMSKALVEDFPEVEASARFSLYGSYLVTVSPEVSYREEKLAFADNSTFDVFTIPFIEGDPSAALVEPNTLVISQTTARKYFGEASAVGRTLKLDNRTEYEVTGVFKDMPANSHFHFDLMASMEGLERSKDPIWVSNNFATYVSLVPGASEDDLEAKLPSLIDKYIGPQVMKFFGLSMDEVLSQGDHASFYVQPLGEIHLHSNLMFELEPNGDIRHVYIFSAIAALILLIACINFMNLTTARSAGRAKEVGVRKAMGSHRGQLINQFLTESVVLSLVSLVGAVLLVELLLPLFKFISGKEISTSYLGTPEIWVVFVGIMVLVGLVSGSYPALYLSRFNPTNILRQNVSLGRGSSWFRSSLVVFQFSVTVILIVGTLVIFQQLSYMQNKKLGYEKEGVIIIHGASALEDNLQPFKNSIKNNSEVVNATLSSFLPILEAGRSDRPYFMGTALDIENSVSMQDWVVDQDYIPTMGMKIMEGRNFEEGRSDDSSAIIINQATVKAIGLEDPIGKTISTVGLTAGGIDPARIESYKIVGVLEDFHFESLHQDIGPLGLVNGKSGGFLSVRVKTDELPAIISQMESEWTKYSSSQFFDYSFLDQEYFQYYQAEQRVSKILTSFTILAIFIACLGLFALVAFIAEQKTKEIGIRKVLGATAKDLVMLLSKDFGRLILIAFVLAIPVAVWITGLWLEDFEYRIKLGAGVFVVAGILALAIAGITMSAQSLKAAHANPIDSLRYE